MRLSCVSFIGRISASWGTSENNRRAKFYALTKAGRQQLVETENWERLAGVMARFLRSATQDYMWARLVAMCSRLCFAFTPTY